VTEVQKAGQATYQMSIRNAVRGLWTVAFDRGQFLDLMGLAIDQGLAAAFAEGAKECGITAAEYTDAEQQALRDAMAAEEMQVLPFAEDIMANSRANGGRLGPLLQRAEMWILRYKDLVNRGRTLACSDGKFKWTLGPTEHCRTCAALAGQVRRGSFWQSHVLPQNAPNPKLECRGFR
jgi:hypothetical protein